uniref:Uncharacterized protein n=1 Tax=Cucumis melo TaxID=3656 RepID=A0A9I9E889_CUCME
MYTAKNSSWQEDKSLRMTKLEEISRLEVLTFCLREKRKVGAIQELVVKTKFSSPAFSSHSQFDIFPPVKNAKRG